MCQLINDFFLESPEYNPFGDDELEIDTKLFRFPYASNAYYRMGDSYKSYSDYYSNDDDENEKNKNRSGTSCIDKESFFNTKKFDLGDSLDCKGGKL